MEFAKLDDLHLYIERNLVRCQYNPSSCVCGWYCFTYANCGHVARRFERKCGKTRSKTSRVVFCRTPPPTHIITRVKASPEHACPDKDCVTTVLAAAADQFAAVNFDFPVVPSPNPPNLPNAQIPQIPQIPQVPPSPFGGASRQSSVARSSPGPDRQPATAAAHSLAGPSVPRPGARIQAHPRSQSQSQPRNQAQTQPQRSQPQRSQPQGLQALRPQTPQHQPQRPQMPQPQTQQPRSQTQTRPQKATLEFEHYQPHQ